MWNSPCRAITNANSENQIQSIESFRQNALQTVTADETRKAITKTRRAETAKGCFQGKSEYPNPNGIQRIMEATLEIMSEAVLNLLRAFIADTFAALARGIFSRLIDNFSEQLQERDL